MRFLVSKYLRNALAAGSLGKLSAPQNPSPNFRGGKGREGKERDGKRKKVVGKGEKEGRLRKGEWRTMRGRTGEGKGKGEGKGRGKGKVKRKGEARREGELILPTMKSWIRHYRQTDGRAPDDSKDRAYA